MDFIFFEDLVNDFADMFAEDNARFNRVRFVEACNWLAEDTEQVKGKPSMQAIREAE